MSSTPNPDIEDLFAALPHALLVPPYETVSDTNIPEPFHHLLVHDRHMTIAMETHHRCKLKVRVLQSHQEQNWYVRQILLLRMTDNVVVQGGIVRINLSMLEKDVQQAILQEDTPLGHVLINNEVLRHIEVTSYVRLEHMNGWPGFPPDTQAFGRLGILFCNRQPAIELFEVIPNVV